MFIKEAAAQAIDPVAAGTIATQGAGKLFEMGILGIMLVATMGFIVFMYRAYQKEREKTMESHKEERAQWLELQQKDNEKRDRMYLDASERHAAAIEKQATSSERMAEAISGLSRDIWRGGTDRGA